MTMDRQIHLVLDIDETLIHTVFIETRDKFNFIKTSPDYEELRQHLIFLEVVDIDNDSPKGIGNITYMILMIRPHLQEFLDFVVNYFDEISIWSAAHFRYVRAIEGALFKNTNLTYHNKLKKVLTRCDCVMGEGTILKDLKEKGFLLKDTLIIDDNDTTFVNNRLNAVHIPKYCPKSIKISDINNDDCLLKVIRWIQECGLKTCPDITLIDKNEIFK